MSPVLFSFEISLQVFLQSKSLNLHKDAETTDLSKLKKLNIGRAVSGTQLSWLLSSAISNIPGGVSICPFCDLNKS